MKRILLLSLVVALLLPLLGIVQPAGADVSAEVLGEDVREVTLGTVDAGMVNDLTVTLEEGDVSFLVVVSSAGRDDATFIDEIAAPMGDTLTGSGLAPQETHGEASQQWPTLASQESGPGDYLVTAGGDEETTVTAFIKSGDIAAPQILDVNVWLANTSPEIDTPAGLAAIEKSWRDIGTPVFGPHDMEIGTINFIPAPDSVIDDFKSLPVPDSQDPSDQQVREACNQMGDATGDQRALQFVLVDEIPNPDDLSGSILGTAASIPGAVIEGDFYNGCVIVARGGDDDTFVGNAWTTWHEAGHLLGLNHSSESDGTSHDFVPDTPECDASKDLDMDMLVTAEECDGFGGDNIMFHDGIGTVLSAGQAFVLKRNPLFKPVPPVEGNAYTPLPPKRLFDTREPEAPSGALGIDGTITVQVTGKAGVPAGATAVVMNVTGTDALTPGFVVAYPGGSTQPDSSNLNLVAGATAPNLVTVPLSADGKVTFKSSGGTHLLADVAGYYSPAGGAVAAGRTMPLTPSRVLDTRSGPGPIGLVAAGTSIDVEIAGKGGVPATGASAVIVNLTGTEAVNKGFATAWPTGQERPLASNINLEYTGHTTPNLAIVPLGTDGKISLYSQQGAHFVADVTGYITDDTATAATAGLFVPVQPGRVFDTREAPAPEGVVVADSMVMATHAGVAGIPTEGVAGVSLNVTGVDALVKGFITVWPSGSDRPLASTLNLDSVGEIRPNAAIMPLGTDGMISYYSQQGAHLIADTNGYYLG